MFRIFVQVTSKIPLNAGPNTPIEKVREFVGEKCGVDGHDMHLFYEDHELEDGHTLTDYGIGENAVIKGMSQQVAEKHREQTQLRCVKDAFEELAEKVKSGVTMTKEMEASALEDAKPFDLECDVMDLSELGSGYPLFFDFIKFLGFICIVIFVLQIPSLVTYAMGPTGPGQGMNSWTTEHEMMPFWYLSPGNLGKGASDSQWPIWANMVSWAAMLFLTVQYSRRQRVIDHQVDIAATHPNDFAIMVEGLPEDAIDEQEIKEFFEEHGCGEHVEVVSVVIGYDVERLKEMIQEFVQLQQEAAQNEDEKTKLLPDMQKLKDTLMNIDSMREECSGTGYCIVTFREQDDQRSCLEIWDSWLENIAHHSYLECLSQTPKFRDEYTLRVKRAENPSDVIWENMSVPYWDRLKLRIRTNAIVVLLLVGCFLLVFGMQVIKERMGSEKRAWSVFPILGIVIGNFVTRLLVTKYVAAERHTTKTDRDTAMMGKLTVGMVLNYALVPVLINMDQDEDWYRKAGLLSDVSMLILVNATLLPLVGRCGIPFHFKLKKAEAIDPAAVDPNMNQAKYNQAYEMPDMNVPRSYANVLKSLLTGLFYAPFFPLGLPITAFGMYNYYWALKRELILHSKHPYTQGNVLAYKALNFLYIAAAIFGFATWFFLSPSLCGIAGTEDQILVGPMILTSLFFLGAPATLRQIMVCSCICFPWLREDTAGDIDYYHAQAMWPKHMKYHCTNLVYQKFEAFRGTRHKRGEYIWDLKTGNITAPEDAVAQQPTEDKPKVPELPKPDEDKDQEDDTGDQEAEDDEGHKTDAAALALEAMKHDVPAALDDLEEKPTTDVPAAHDASDAEGDDQGKFQAGERATVCGLTEPKFQKLNGELCTLQEWDASVGKWVVQIEINGKTQSCRLAVANLEPADGLTITPGMKCTIVGLTSDKGEKWNNTVCTAVDFDASSGKWLVTLWTGAKGPIAVANLEPHEDDDTIDG